MRALAFTLSFLIAFLLFSVQPMATKLVLPILGGTPAVWNTAMFTFQFLLLLGYLYAHLLSSRVRLRWQLPLHALLVAYACWFLPMTVTLASDAGMLQHPISHLVAAFLQGIGLPFLCLSATAPLLQSWVSRSKHPLSQTPYVLYSASNLGSFAGLLGYVLLIEPQLTLAQQRMGWSGLFVAGMLLLLMTGKALHFGAAKEERAVGAVPDWRARLTWIWLAFLPSSLSLGVTTHIATDIASIPLLWVIPLSLYLLSFVDAFRLRPVYVPFCQRIAPLVALVAIACYAMSGRGITALFILELAIFAVLALAIHGWLAKRKPAHAYLTQFYLCLSVGGALGGVLNGLVAPLLLRDALEYPAVLLLASLSCYILLRQQEASTSLRAQLSAMARIGAHVLVFTFFIYLLVLALYPALLHGTLDTMGLMFSAGAGGFATMLLYRRFEGAYYACATVMLLLLVALSNGLSYETLYKDRNFFGVSRIYENSEAKIRYLIHDTTLHGLQSLEAAKAHQLVAYYWPVKEIMAQLPATRTAPIAAVGLGVGIVACAAHPQQEVDFFEINPMSAALAENPDYFTYLRDCPGKPHVTLSDGRIGLSQQLDKRYGVIVLDAFSSDAIPAHLLTHEALSIYLAKLAPQGVLLIHTTNRHINLWPLLAAQAKQLGAVAYGKFFEAPKDDSLMLSSYWVVLAPAGTEGVAKLGASAGWQKLEDEGARPWTDQYINLLPYFKVLR